MRSQRRTRRVETRPGQKMQRIGSSVAGHRQICQVRRRTEPHVATRKLYLTGDGKMNVEGRLRGGSDTSIDETKVMCFRCREWKSNCCPFLPVRYLHRWHAHPLWSSRYSNVSRLWWSQCTGLQQKGSPPSNERTEPPNAQKEGASKASTGGPQKAPKGAFPGVSMFLIGWFLKPQRQAGDSLAVLLP